MNKLFYNGTEVSRDSDLSIYKFNHLDKNGDTHLKLKTFKELFKEKLREKYDYDDELAIQRQKDKKPEEFAEYYAYAEACKVEAKKLLGVEEDV